MEAVSAPRPRGLRITKPRRLLAALSDDRLVEYVRRGDDAAFEVLYDRHSPGALAFCRHMLRSQHDAEDAVQHAFIAAHADLHRHTERQIHFKAWLYTIARNRCLSVLRARREHPAEDLELVTDSLSDDVQQRDDLRALLADVHKLPDDQREALVLSEVGDLSHSEVAAVIGCEASKVKSLVFQARSALIDRRLARETSCEEIREQIATLRGGALRRSHLRHHLDSCPGCTAYREDVRRQRQMLGLALPVVPSALLRHDVMAAIGLGGGATAATSAGVVGSGAAVAAKSGLAKVGIAALLAGGAAGGAAVVHNGGLPSVGGSSTPAEQQIRGGAPISTPGSTVRKAAAGAPATTIAGGHGEAKAQGKKGDKAGSRSESGTQHGFTPVQGGSNGAAARERAARQGQGSHSGITKPHKNTPARTRTRGVHSKPVHVKKTPPQNTPNSPSSQTTTPNTQTAPATEPAPSSLEPSNQGKSGTAPLDASLGTGKSLGKQ